MRSKQSYFSLIVDMDLYHDEYSVFYHYDTVDTNKPVNGHQIDNDVIEVPSDSDNEEVLNKTELNSHDNDQVESDFDEDFDEEDENNTQTFENDLSLDNGDTMNNDYEDYTVDLDMQVMGVNSCETLENTDGTYRCPLCPKEVVSKYNLKRHMMIHTGEKPHKCPTCFKGFREQSDLRKHKKVHIYGNRLFECNICFRSYQSYKATKCYHCDGDDEDLPPPNTFEDESKLYNCFLCPTTNLTVAQLKRHLIEIHPATNRVTYNNLGNFNHSNSNSNGVSNGVKTKTVSTFSGSRNVEDMEKIHKCNVCAKAFRSKQFLMLHTLTHANNRIEPSTAF
uniref:CSON001933 protein n=2 Tax=Culicoides sonorensis TaxID=179676 RepID=A0A336MJ96_CULSO